MPKQTVYQLRWLVGLSNSGNKAPRAPILVVNKDAVVETPHTAELTKWFAKNTNYKMLKQEVVMNFTETSNLQIS